MMSRLRNSRRAAVTAMGAIALAAVAGAWWLRCRAPADRPRPNAETQMAHTNRLAHEKSPYLRQHAHNPVDWFPWGEEAFEKARREDKPIFLSVGYSTCHWCHVMARESFEDEGIARLLNEHFVAIKVDREERPDVDEAYLGAVQVMTGRGGWPMSAFLLPDGRPFYGGTYYPREQFARLLERLAQMYREDRGQIERSAREVTEAVAELARPPERAAGAAVSRAMVRRGLSALHRSFDAERGGFGSDPKFPPHGALALLLSEYRRTGEEGLLQMATVTLDGMALGGIHDHLGGGFHRYSTDERWFLPHFEKMLYDNALLARAYVDAYALTKDPLYRQVAEGIFAWLKREMTGPGGQFYAALDAESEGVEGRFYLWRREEIEQVLGDEADLFCSAYGVEPGGNFADGVTGASTGDSVLHRRQRPPGPAAGGDATAAGAEQRLARARRALLDARGGRPRPRRDEKVITAWNGLMIGALARAGVALGQPEYTEMAERAAQFARDHLRRDGSLLRRWCDGEARFPGALEDYVFLADGLLELHAATGRQEWLAEARAVMEAAIAECWDERDGGFFSTAASAEQLFVRMKGALDHPLPSGNGAAALVLLRLAEVTGERRYGEYAERTLWAMQPWMERASYGTETLLVATAAFLDGREAEPSPAADEAPPPQAAIAEQHPVRMAATASRARVAPGERLDLAVELRIASGWHINSHRPRQDFLVPTEVTVEAAAPLQVGPIIYPEGKEIEVAGDTLSVYDGAIALSIPLTLPSDARPGRQALDVRLRFQACDNSSCLPPDEVSARLPFTVVRHRRPPAR